MHALPFQIIQNIDLLTPGGRAGQKRSEGQPRVELQNRKSRRGIPAPRRLLVNDFSFSF